MLTHVGGVRPVGVDASVVVEHANATGHRDSALGLVVSQEVLGSVTGVDLGGA